MFSGLGVQVVCINVVEYQQWLKHSRTVQENVCVGGRTL